MKRSLKVFLFATLCFVVLETGFIGHIQARESVFNVIHSFYKDNGLPGLSVAVRKGDHTSATYRFGYGNLELKDKISKDSVFRIASVAKLFTTAGIMLLKEQGKLSVYDTLSKYIPSFPYGDSITLKNLLQHTSGIPNFVKFKPFADNQAKDWKPNELVGLLEDYLTANPLDFEPGTTADYSNSNFTLLGVIIEKVSGMAFSDFTARYVVEPLGMRNTAVGSDTRIIPHRVAGYRIEDGVVTNAPFVSVTAPFATGDFLSQPVELAKISRIFTAGVLLDESTIGEMSQPAVLKDGSEYIVHDNDYDFSYGYCWELVKPKGKAEWVYTKSGGMSGFLAYVFYFRSADVTVTISSNAQGDFSLLDLGLKIGEAMDIMR